ncbi:MAG: xylulose kinase [Chloroflexi bacterium OLB15]|nr:MAG: xylulose kinase [Chloroflexi bacterium OLB15]
MAYLLGLDISTTGAKALIVDHTGQVIASHTTPQPISTPKPLWSEQNPADWWGGIAASIRAALAESGLRGDDIAAVGLTGQMHGLVLQDAAGNVLRPAILWNDQRTASQCEQITEKVGFHRLIELTGNRALTGFTAPKILWVQENEPEVYAKTAHFLLPKDYLRFKLTGDYALDLSDAAGTLLLDVANRRWSTEVIDALGIPYEWLPALFEGTEITSMVTATAATETGLRVGTPVVGGGGDQAAGAAGVGAVREGIIGLAVGTSGVVFAPLERYAYEPDGLLHAFCHAAPGLWHFMGRDAERGRQFAVVARFTCAGRSFDELVGETADIPAGSEGLLFLPYLTGERTPHPDPLARGAFVGLTVRHSKAHMTRAVLEGVSFGLKDSFELMRAAGMPVRQIRVQGGGAKSAIWRQILADVLNAPLARTSTTDGAAFGAAVLAAVGAKVYPNVQTACEAMVQITDETLPSSHAPDYINPYALYRTLYPALKETFTRI